jgi:superfamily II DNA or RNA helicase
MKVIIESPTEAILSGSDAELQAAKEYLVYTHTGNAMMLRRHLKNVRWRNSDPVGWKKAANDLQAKVNHRLYEEFGDGLIKIRPGSIHYLQKKGFDINVITKVSYQSPKPQRWYSPLPFELHPYQKESVEKLLEAKHGTVTICTGGGKTAIIMKLARELGLKTVIMTPSASIFNEILKGFEAHFGKDSVGALGDGKKRLGKKFIVAISKSLTNLKPGTKEHDEIASAQVLLADEAHTLPASTLEEVCHGVLKDTPYRLFFTGTHVRNDGTQKLLEAITGPVVKTLSTKEAIENGYVCDHEFRIVKVKSTTPLFQGRDALEMKRKHFLHNKNIAELASKIALSAYQAKKEQTLILIDEVKQIDLIMPFFDNKGLTIATAIGNNDPGEAVDAFNTGRAQVLIGTSCISTGTNIFPVHHMINWQGGSSEIKTKQGAVGRSVRKLKGSKYEKFHVPKEKSIIWDFDVIGIDDMERHLATRIDFYADSGTPIRRL